MNERIRKIRERTKLGGKQRTPANFVHQKNLKIRKELDKELRVAAANKTYYHELAVLFDEKLQRTQQMHDMFQEQLRRENPIHPCMDASFAVADRNVPCDALYYRIAAPTMKWDDDEDTGFVRLECLGKSGTVETVGYAFTKYAFNNHQSYIMDKVIKDIADEVADEMSKYIPKIF